MLPTLSLSIFKQENPFRNLNSLYLNWSSFDNLLFLMYVSILFQIVLSDSIEYFPSGRNTIILSLAPIQVILSMVLNNDCISSFFNPK